MEPRNQAINTPQWAPGSTGPWHVRRCCELSVLALGATEQGLWTCPAAQGTAAGELLGMSATLKPAKLLTQESQRMRGRGSVGGVCLQH